MDAVDVNRIRQLIIEAREHLSMDRTWFVDAKLEEAYVLLSGRSKTMPREKLVSRGYSRGRF